jgi:hypothetical protein
MVAIVATAGVDIEIPVIRSFGGVNAAPPARKFVLFARIIVLK